MKNEKWKLHDLGIKKFTKKNAKAVICITKCPVSRQLPHEAIGRKSGISQGYF